MASSEYGGWLALRSSSSSEDGGRIVRPMLAKAQLLC